MRARSRQQPAPSGRLGLAISSFEAVCRLAPQAVIAHVGLDRDPLCLEFHRSARAVTTASYDKIRRPIYASSVWRAQAYPPWLDPLQRVLAAP